MQADFEAEDVDRDRTARRSRLGSAEPDVVAPEAETKTKETAEKPAKASKGKGKAKAEDVAEADA